MSPLRLYWASLAGLLLLLSIALLVNRRTRVLPPFTTVELATLALLICLLEVAVLPWQVGLSRLPGLDALVFSIPYTAVFLLGVRLVQKPGTAVLLIFGQGLFGQLLGRGLNPAWWPYYLWSALAVELFLLATRGRAGALTTALGAGVLRGLLSYAYMYLILAPFLWHQFYARWYVGLKLALGTMGCLLGAWLAWRLAPAVERASRHAGL